MSHYTARVIWNSESNNFLKNDYSREHRWEFDGGISVAASASPQIVPEPWSKPSNVDPEEAFVAALASCHMLFFLDLAAQAGYVVEMYDDNAEGLLAKDSDGVMMMTKVELKPHVVFSTDHQPSIEDISKLHHEAHNQCFIANSVSTQIKITPQ